MNLNKYIGTLGHFNLWLYSKNDVTILCDDMSKPLEFSSKESAQKYANDNSLNYNEDRYKKAGENFKNFVYAYKVPWMEFPEGIINMTAEQIDVFIIRNKVLPEVVPVISRLLSSKDVTEFNLVWLETLLNSKTNALIKTLRSSNDLEKILEAVNNTDSYNSIRSFLRTLSFLSY